MALFRKFFYRKPPDGLLEISDRVYVFDSCFSTDVLEEDEFKVYMGGVVLQLRDHFPDASFMVFNFREGERQSQISEILSEFDMTVMDYPRHYEGCPLLTMEMVHHFLRSSESWLSLGQQNVLLMHCERGGWPVLAFMLAGLLIYRKQYTGEQKTLDMIYKQAPRELLQLLSPLNPIPSQLRYLQYVSRRNVGTEWPPLDRALTLDCVILRMIPNFDEEKGCRPIFRIYGQDPFIASDRTPKVLFSTPKRSKNVRLYKQVESELVKIDVHCHIQGDVVLECINLDFDQEREEMMFRVMFNTAFIRSNILILSRDEIDILWKAKDLFPKEFRAEVLLSEMDTSACVLSVDLPNIEEKEGIPVEAFAKVQEIFNAVDWYPKADAAVSALQRDASANALEVEPELLSPQNRDTAEIAPLDTQERFKIELDSPQHLVLDGVAEYQKPDSVKDEMKFPAPFVLNQPIEIDSTHQNVQFREVGETLQTASLPKILSQRVPQKSLSLPVSYFSSLQGSPLSISRYQSAPSLLGISDLLQDRKAFVGKDFSLSLSSPKSLPSFIDQPSVSRKERAVLLKPVSPLHSSLSPRADDGITGIRSSPGLFMPTQALSSLHTESDTQAQSPSKKSWRPMLVSDPSLVPSTPTPLPSEVLTSPLCEISPNTQSTMSRIAPPKSVPVPPSSPVPFLPTKKDGLTSTLPLLKKDKSHLPPPPPPPPPITRKSTLSSSPSAPPPPSTPPTPFKENSLPFITPPPPPPPPPFAQKVMAAASANSFQRKLSASAPKQAPPPPPPPAVRPSSNLKPNSLPAAPPPPPPPFQSTKGVSAIPPVPPPTPGGNSQMMRGAGAATPQSGVKGVAPPPPGLSPSLSMKSRQLSRSASPKIPSVKRTALKPLHWVKVTRAMQGSLWAEAQKQDEFSKPPEFDMTELESLFSAVVPNSDQGKSSEKSSRRTSLGGKPDKIHLIDLRRANNCEIMLTKVKIPLSDLMVSVLALDDRILDIDQVENLIKFCPTKEEMEMLKGFSGDKENLGKCEQFFMELMKVPRVEGKLRVFSFTMQFRAQVSDLSNNLNLINSAADEIRKSAKLKRIMQTILSLGNALNQGTARGSAVGFRLDSLLKLTDTRARNNKMTLMHYLCKILSERWPELLDFQKDLVSLEATSKIQLKTLAEEMQAISKGLEKIEQELTASENDGPISQSFCKLLNDFLIIAEAEVRSLTSLYSCVGRNADALAIYFGEDPARCPFEQVVSTLLNFVRMFARAHDENCKQFELEKKKAQKEVESEKMKISTPKKEMESLLQSPLKRTTGIK